jgi:hypothetical protein
MKSNAVTKPIRDSEYMDNEAKIVQEEGAGASKCLAWIPVLALLAVLAILLLAPGCTTAKKYGPMVVHAVFDLTGNTNKVESVSVDAVPWDSLVWDSGGFKPASSTVVKGNISEVEFNGRMLTYQAMVEADWGKEGDAPNATICALFVKGDDGVWRGGKFDWISSNRLSRGLGHITGPGYYSNWDGADIPNPCDACFVIVSVKTGTRTNVVKASWKR